jgi:DNA-binding response OmpR family regulator
VSAHASRILVVDDDDSIRQFIVMALGDAGYEVESAEDGQAALRALETVPPDLILLDMRMPVMDGWAFSGAYRRLAVRHVPLVVLTAARDAAQTAAEVGADGFLAKPFELHELLALVRDFLDRG